MGGAEQGGDRVLGTYGGERPGPVLVLVGGIHGNEGAGVRAAERVLAWLATAEVPLRGRVVALVGNAPALAAGARFVDVDLNRGWSPGRVAAARAGELAVATSEDAQQRALLGALDAARRRASEALGFAVLDLHSFSAAGAPFVVTCASERTLAMARAAGLPAITGLERQIPGTFVEFCCGDGAPALGVEGGTHDDPATARQLSAVVVRVLRHLGMVAAEDVDDGGVGAGRAGEGDGPPEVVEIVYRHAIGPDDGFRMRPGYRNLARVREGEELADDARGPVRAPRDGWLVMPLYQGQGDDGFFLGVEREG